MLNHYEDFLARVDELGFLPLSPLVPGLPSLSDETPPAQWHTGDRETDPWCWKDRAAEEKRLAYGCILGGHKGFVSARLYPIFYAACRPVEPMPSRWSAGTVTLTTWQLWQLFEQKTLLNTSDVRREMGVTAAKGGSRVDAALKSLQREYYLTVAGSRKKVAKDGQPYGWAASVFDRVQHWAPAEWLQPTSALRSTEAMACILDVGMTIGSGVDRQALAEKLFGAQD